MAKDKEQNTGINIEKSKGYAINPAIAYQGYAGDYKKLGGGFIVVSKPFYENNIDPKTGQIGPVLKKASTLFIDTVEIPEYEIPADYPMAVLYSLAFAHIILPTDEQAKALNEWAKKKSIGK